MTALNFGDSRGIRLGFQGDSHANLGIRVILTLEILGDSPEELAPFTILKGKKEWGSGILGLVCFYKFMVIPSF